MIIIIIIILFQILNIGLAEAKQCPKEQYWVNAFHRRAYVKADGTRLSAANVSAHCRTKSKEQEYLEPRFKNWLPKGWPRNEKGKPWTLEERELLIEALSALPDELNSINVTGIYRGEKAVDPLNPGAHLDGDIVLYDEAFGEKQNLTRVVAHELAHQIFQDLSPSDQGSYESSTGWDKVKDQYVGREDGYLEEDSKKSPSEDFANNIEYHIFQTEKLSQVTPAASNWIKKHFTKDFHLKEIKK